MNKKEEIKLLQQALKNIETVNRNYWTGSNSPEIFIPTTCIERSITKLSFSERTNIPLYEIAVMYEYNIELSKCGLHFKITNNPFELTNKTTNYKFTDKEDYIQIDNNIGRLIFGKIPSWYYEITDSIYKAFQDELISYNVLDYDKSNDSYIYKEKDGVRLYGDIEVIFNKYKAQIDECIRDREIQKLQEKIDKLRTEGK